MPGHPQRPRTARTAAPRRWNTRLRRHPGSAGFCLQLTTSRTLFLVQKSPVMQTYAKKNAAPVRKKPVVQTIAMADAAADLNVPGAIRLRPAPLQMRSLGLAIGAAVFTRKTLHNRSFSCRSRVLIRAGLHNRNIFCRLPCISSCGLAESAQTRRTRARAEARKAS